MTSQDKEVRERTSTPPTRDWFEEWRSLDEFEFAVEQSRPDESDMRGQRFKFWREAWVAARFARKTGEGEVRLRLTVDSSPLGDFEMKDRAGTRGCEIAEALDPSMPPALKKLHSEGGTVLQESEAAVSGALARETIPRLIAQKAAKGYPRGTGLVIYMNLWDDFERTGLGGLVPTSKHEFGSIWLLSSDVATRLFPFDEE